MAPIPPELAELLEAACNGELTEAQFEQLQKTLESDAEARSTYVRYMALDTDLWAGDYDISPIDNAVPAVQLAEPVAPRARARTVLAAVGVALLVGVVYVGSWLSRGTSKDSPAEAVATLTRAVDAQWASNARATGDELRSGSRLKLSSGLVEVTFRCGARLVIQGSTVLELQSGTSTRLHRGQLVGHVPPEAAGFAVVTPSTTVVDMGTEFGVSVDADGTADVVVFDGEVDVQRPPNEEAETAETMPESIRLNDGEAARVFMDRIETDASVDSSRFTRIAQLTDLTRHVAIEDGFSGEQLDADSWQVHLPRRSSAVALHEQQCELVNRGYLATADEYDPLALGGIRVKGKWRFVTPANAVDNKRVNILTIVLRGDVRADPPYAEASGGIFFKCYSNNAWANIGAYGEQIEITKPRRHGRVARDRGDVYEFEIHDDGKRVSFKFWEVGSPDKVAHSTATVVRDTSSSNHILFFCREQQPPNWTYKVLLDDVSIETGVGPVP